MRSRRPRVWRGLALCIVLAASALHSPSAGASRDSWEAIHDARLMEASRGNSTAAVEALTHALEQLDTDAPERGELMYWLGRTRYFAGDIEGAYAALEAALLDADSRPRAWAFLVRMDAREKRVVALPYTESFARDTGAWVRGWTRSEDGDLTRVDGAGPGGICLAWTTIVREGEEDFIFVDFDDKLEHGPSHVRMFVRARRFPTNLRIVLEDEDGQLWTSPVQMAPTNDWASIDLSLSSFVPLDDPKSSRRFPASAVRALFVKDETAFNATDRGENIVLIDDVEVK